MNVTLELELLAIASYGYEAMIIYEYVRALRSRTRAISIEAICMASRCMLQLNP